MMTMMTMRVTVTTTRTNDVVENIIEKIENSVIVVTKEVVAKNTRDREIVEEEVVDPAPIPTASPQITMIIHLLLCTLDLDLDHRRTKRRRGRTRIRRRDQNIGMMGIIGGIEETTTVVEVVEVEVEIEVINMKGIVKKRKDVHHHLLLDLPMRMKLVPLWKSWNDVNKRDDGEDD